MFFFFVVLWFCGGKKGLLSALGLILTFLCIIKIFLPLIYRGCSPVTAAVIVVILSTFCSIYLLNGFSEKSICAISGTVCGVLIAAFFSFIFCKISHISGMNVSDIESLVYISQVTDIQTGKLLFAGILISSLGAVMDVAVSLSSTMFEIKQQNKAISSRELFKSGMNVGRDMMGTMSNTLILAFAGGSINTLVFIYSYKYSYFQTLNMYSIGIELIQGIAATLGVVLTVPLTCAICTFVYERNK